MKKHLVNNKMTIIDIVLDFLIIFCILFQDIYKFTLFGTPFYKYVIIIILLLLSFDYIHNKKKITINIALFLVLLIIYSYTYLISFCKTIIVPSVFFVIEIATFMLYFKKNDSYEIFKKRFANIIFCSAIILSFLGVIQFLAYKLDIPIIYNNITQFSFYLNEGRITSIYSEPAHLCAILCAGLFLSILNIVTGKSNINYLFLIALLFTISVTGSVVVYFSLFLFLLLCVYAITVLNRKEAIIKKKVFLVAIISILTIGLSLVFFERNVINGAVNKVYNLFSKDNYNVEDNSLDGYNKFNGKKYEIDVENIQNNTELQNIIMYSQLSNSSAYAIKSNIYIGIDKLRDKYFFGTGMFTHIVYYDKYMQKQYSNGYVRVNYSDAALMPLRVFSEFGIIGLIVFVLCLLYLLFKGIKEKDLFLLFVWCIFVTQSIRLGEYNWVLNCFSFLILLSYIKMPKKFYKDISINCKNVQTNSREKNNKRILAMTGVFLPHNETVTQISYKILCNLDYDIDVVAFKGTIDDSFEKLIKNDRKFKKFHIHYIDVDWKSLDINSHNCNIFKIKKYLFMYNKKCMELFKRWNYNVVFSFSIPNYTHMPAYKIKKKYGNKVLWFASFSDPIINNLYIEEFKKGRIRTKILYYLLKLTTYRNKYQKVALKYSDYLIFISEALKKHVVGNKKEYIDKSIIYPITYVKEWPNYKLLTCDANKKHSKKIIMSHFGNIYGLRKIDEFLEAICELKDEYNSKLSRIEIHQYGEIHKKQMELFKNEKLNSILFVHDKVNYDECIELMKKSDVLLIFDTIVDKNEFQPYLPSKITDYLLTNKPIFAITNKNSSLYDIINKRHICVENDVNSIKNGLLKQMSNIKEVKNDIIEYDNDYVSKKVFGNILDIVDLRKGE